MKLKPVPRNGRNKLTYIYIRVDYNKQPLPRALKHAVKWANSYGNLPGGILPRNQGTVSLCPQILNTLRDLDYSMTFFETLIQKGCRIFMFGHDIPDLMERIHFPAIYWSSWIAEALDGIIPSPKIWVVIIPTDRLQSGRSVDSERSDELFDYLIQLPDGKDI